MPGWQPNWDDVAWDWGAANEAMNALRRAADMLDQTAYERKRKADQATAEWRGVYREEFDEDLRGILTRARDLARDFRDIANRISRASGDARREQDHREEERERWWRQYWDEQE